MPRIVKALSGRKLLRWQYEAIQDSHSVKAFLGGYGSGKTTGAAMDFCLNALKNPWREDYGDNQPESLCIGKTDKVIKDSSMKAIRGVIGPLIRKEWKSPGERSMLLCNGHMIKFRTWSGSIEGATACGVMLDEAHLLDDSLAFTNYIARMRDPLATQKRFIIAGIPEFGWLRETFGPGASYPDSRVWNISALENTYLMPEDIERIRASCDSRTVETYLKGNWTSPQGAIFYEYDPLKHIIQDPGDKSQAVDLAIDVGDQAACVFLQERGDIITRDGARVAGKRLHVVDQILPDKMSMAQILRAAKNQGWKIKPGRSLVFVDPTTDRDEKDAIGRELPGVQFVQKKRADMDRNREYGFRCVNAAFSDSDGNCRLTLSKNLKPHRRGLLEALPSFKRHETSGRPVKDNRMDHVLDCLRYAVAHHLPLKGVHVK